MPPFSHWSMRCKRMQREKDFNTMPRQKIKSNLLDTVVYFTSEEGRWRRDRRRVAKMREACEVCFEQG